jgi:prevent-host-death family protein
MYIAMYTFVMKRIYSVGSARANLPAILDDVQSGQVIQVTRHGKPVAVILSPGEYASLERRQSPFSEACAEFRQRFAVKELGLERDDFASLRDQRPGRKVRL